jgi:hypothetical protein
VKHHTTVRPRADMQNAPPSASQLPQLTWSSPGYFFVIGRRYRTTSVLLRIVIAAVLVAATAMSLSGQTPLRTPWGDPDLQGSWPNEPLSAIPFERSKEFGLRAQLTDAEFAERVAALQRQAAADAA